MPYGQNLATCSKCGGSYFTGDCIELDASCEKCKTGYESYGDWYDNGPGSEKFKRECRTVPEFTRAKRIEILDEALKKIRNDQKEDLKTKISDVITDALSGQDEDLRTEDGFIRWGLVQKRIHKAIDDCWEKL